MKADYGFGWRAPLLPSMFVKLLLNEKPAVEYILNRRLFYLTTPALLQARLANFGSRLRLCLSR